MMAVCCDSDANNGVLETNALGGIGIPHGSIAPLFWLRLLLG